MSDRPLNSVCDLLHQSCGVEALHKAQESEDLNTALSPFFERQWRKHPRYADKIVAVKSVPITTEFGESSLNLVVEYEANTEKPFVLRRGFSDFIGMFATAKGTLEIVSKIED